MNLSEVVHSFRRAIETHVNSSSHAEAVFSGFPNGCCEESSILLAAYMSDKGFRGARKMSIGNTGTEISAHIWLDYEGLYIDITADQFNNFGFNNPSVIISSQDVFLNSLNGIKGEIADFRICLEQTKDEGLLDDYKESLQKAYILMQNYL